MVQAAVDGFEALALSSGQIEKEEEKSREPDACINSLGKNFRDNELGDTSQEYGIAGDLGDDKRAAAQSPNLQFTDAERKVADIESGKPPPVSSATLFISISSVWLIRKNFSILAPAMGVCSKEKLRPKQMRTHSPRARVLDHK